MASIPPCTGDPTGTHELVYDHEDYRKGFAVIWFICLNCSYQESRDVGDITKLPNRPLTPEDIEDWP